MGSRFFGILIVAVGAVLLLGNMGLIPSYSLGELISTFWPAMVVYWGLGWLFNEWRGRGGFWGAIWPIAVTLFGAVLILKNLHVLVDVNLWDLIWPVGLVLVGLSLLFGKSWKQRVVTSISYTNANKQFDDRERFEAERKIKTTVGELRLGGAAYKLESSNIEMKAGNVTIDLRDTFIPDGETVLDIEVKAGDVDIRLPDDLAVSVQASVKFGTVDLIRQSATNGTLSHQSENYETAEKKVKLLVSVKFGDIDVKQIG